MNKKLIRFDLENLSSDWWLRSAGFDNSYTVGFVNYDGNASDYSARDDYGELPTCFEI